MSKEVESSISYRALSKPGRKVYALLAAEIANGRTGSVAITSADMMAALSVSSSSSVASSVRELKALGLISIAKGKRCIGVYSLATDWQAVTDLDEAKRAASAARLPPKRRPKSRHHVMSKRRKAVEVPAEPEAEPEEQPRVRAVTLPVFPWPTPAGLRLLEESL